MSQVNKLILSIDAALALFILGAAASASVAGFGPLSIMIGALFASLPIAIYGDVTGLMNIGR